MSDQERISLCYSNTIQADRRWELRKVSILGLFVGPMLNSPKEHDKDFIVDNKENY